MRALVFDFECDVQISIIDNETDGFGVVDDVRSSAALKLVLIGTIAAPILARPNSYK